MGFNIVMAIISLAIILLSCTLFTNSIEWIGKKLNLSQGAVGSVLAAVGTALPETLIPIIAIVFSTGINSNDIGIGAIAGAPFMLTTLALFITGLSVIVYSALGKRSLKMNVDANVLSRDLVFFIVAYTIAITISFVNTIPYLKELAAILLVLIYVLYVKKTFSDQSQALAEPDKLFLSKVTKTEVSLPLSIFQTCLGLGGIVFGAHLFIEYVELLSHLFGIAPLVFSLIVTPIATELPEKINSILWIGKKKDTLALGNITGAFVFQSCFPVAFGLAFTSWALTGITIFSAILAISSALFLLAWLKIKKTLNPFVLLSGGLLYCIFIVYVFK